MSIFKNNLTYFTYFKKTLDKFTEIDPREINFQNRIIIPLLEDILSDRESISVVDVSNQYKSSTNHTRDSYAGIHTPDLLIAENWNYENNNNSSINYIALVEVKSPILEPINFENLNQHTKNEISCYLELQERVILTDCIRWCFYTKSHENIVYDLSDILDANEYENDPQKWSELCNYIKTFLSDF